MTARIDDLFRRMQQLEASDLHLVAGRPVRFRLHGELATGDENVISNEACRDMLLEICPERLRPVFLEEHDLDFAYGLEGVGRFRCNYFFHEKGTAGVFRIIPEEVTPLPELGLPEAIESLAHLDEGLVLITGPTGSGKSTTLAALIDIINTTYAKHVITIEDPIEFVHDHRKSVITQREIGSDAASFGQAVQDAIRQDPDVLLVGEMRDFDTVRLALTAAEMGILVFATLHTNSAAKTMDRIIDFFPAEAQDQARAALGDSLQAVVSQLLIRRTDGIGRVAATEVLLNDTGLPALIREGKIGMMYSYIQKGKEQGMVSMDDSLVSLVKQRLVNKEDAFRRAQNREQVGKALGISL